MCLFEVCSSVNYCIEVLNGYCLGRLKLTLNAFSLEFSFQANALRAICPATVDVLLQILASDSESESSDVQSEEFVCLWDVVLLCVVLMVKTLHACNPEEVSTGIKSKVCLHTQ